MYLVLIIDSVLHSLIMTVIFHGLQVLLHYAGQRAEHEANSSDYLDVYIYILKNDHCSLLSDVHNDPLDVFTGLI